MGVLHPSQIVGFRWAAYVWDDCDDNDPTTQLGFEQFAADSCLAILNGGDSSGMDYWLDNDGTAYQTYCDMTIDGGVGRCGKVQALEHN